MTGTPLLPVPPPNQWSRSLKDPYPYDIVTGDAHIDREIARNRGLYPQPLWWRIRRWFRGGTASSGAR
jgi:hypothetical protein